MNNLAPKKVSESRSVSTDLVLPNETNHYGNMFGGELLARMDRVGTIAAVRHSGCVVVTAAVNSVSFNKTIPQGSVVTVEASISRAFTSSMEVYIDVWVEDSVSGERIKSNEAIYTFVALNAEDKPVAVPEIIPETDLSWLDVSSPTKPVSYKLFSKIWKINSHSALPIGFSDKPLGHFPWDCHRVHIG